jgi:hypothetical protein
MDRLCAVGVLAVVAACAGDPDRQTIKERLIGNWGSERFTVAKALLVDFYDNGSYQLIVGQSSGLGSLEMQITLGDYHLRDGENGLDDDDGDYLFLTPYAASCPGGALPEAFWVSFTGDSLKLRFDAYLVVLDALPDEAQATDGDGYDGGFTATTGCFTDTGFVPFAVQAF